MPAPAMVAGSGERDKLKWSALNRETGGGSASITAGADLLFRRIIVTSFLDALKNPSGPNEQIANTPTGGLLSSRCTRRAGVLEMNGLFTKDA